MVCLLAALWVQLSVSAGKGWPHNVLQHHWLMAISCHFRDCKGKALLVTSLTYVSGAITSVQTFTFYVYLTKRQRKRCNQKKITIYMYTAPWRSKIQKRLDDRQLNQARSCTLRENGCSYQQNGWVMAPGSYHWNCQVAALCIWHAIIRHHMGSATYENVVYFKLKH